MKQQPPCDDKASLIAYLYNECDAAERRLIEEHLKTCASCAAELENLRGVRVALREWAPPDQALGFRVVRDEPAPRDREQNPSPARWWRRGGGIRVPAWAQLAAAVLVLAVGAAIANLDVRIGNGALTIKTGWQEAPAVTSASAARGGGAAAPWRADLAALERQLRREISAHPVADTTRTEAGSVPGPTTATAVARLSPDERAALLRTVQTLIGDMERRQQREVDQQIAERFLRFARDVDTQRIADQRRFLQGLSQIDVRTTQLSQVSNYLLRVANVQEIK